VVSALKIPVGACTPPATGKRKMFSHLRHFATLGCLFPGTKQTTSPIKNSRSQLLISANAEGTNETRPDYLKPVLVNTCHPTLRSAASETPTLASKIHLHAGCCKDLVDQWYLEVQGEPVAPNIRVPAPAQTRTDANACRLSAKFAGTASLSFFYMFAGTAYTA